MLTLQNRRILSVALVLALASECLAGISLALSHSAPRKESRSRGGAFGLIVTNANDSGPGSLRDAIDSIPTGGTVEFDPNFFNVARTITLTSNDLTISRDMVINGPGADLLTVVGPGNSRVFRTTAQVALIGMKITGGNIGVSNGGGISNNGNLIVRRCHVTGNTGEFGGGISNTGSGQITVIDSAVTGNTANERGGGIDSTGILSVINSTVSGNVTLDTGGSPDGGGIWTRTATIINSTITNNTVTAANSAAGVYRDSGSVVFINTIVAKNVNNATFPDVVSGSGGGVASDGYNLIGNAGTLAFSNSGDQSGDGNAPLDPQLAPLGMNGGTTPTHALLPASPALDKGTNFGYITDQRGFGFGRPVDLPIANAPGGDGSDIGAFEAQTAPAVFVVTGRVFSTTGIAQRSQSVILTHTASGVRRIATTSTFGVYIFNDVAPGSYVVSVASKRYRYAPVNLTVTENVNDLNFTGLE